MTLLFPWTLTTNNQHDAGTTSFNISHSKVMGYGPPSGSRKVAA
jgi:hypothetical protein